jgi:hypothetical protein
MDRTEQPNATHTGMSGRPTEEGGPSDADPIAADRTRAHSAGMSESEEHLRIQLSEARADTKFAQLIGEMRAGFAGVDARLSAVERSTSGVKTTVIGTGVAVVAVVIAILAYGQTWFGIGVNTRDIIRATVSEYIQQTPQQAPSAPEPHAGQPAPARRTP